MLTKDVRSSFGTHRAPSPAAAVTRRKSRRKLCDSYPVPTDVVNTSPCSCHASPACARSAACRSRCPRSASTAISGSFSVRRDRFVLVSPCARTDRHTEIVPASRSTCSHVSARASSDRTPVSRHSTMNACSREASAASSSAEA